MVLSGETQNFPAFSYKNPKMFITVFSDVCYRDSLTDKYDYVREENFDNGAITIKSFRESPDMKGLFSLRSLSSS